MQTVIDVLLVLAPEIAILMPIGSLFLGVLQGPIKLHIAHTGNLLVGFILVIEAQELGQQNDLIPDVLGELNEFLLLKIDIFYADASMFIDGLYQLCFPINQALNACRWENYLMPQGSL